MTHSVLTFSLKPGVRDEFVRTFRELEVLAVSSALPGYRNGQLHVDTEDAETAMVIAAWDSPEAYQGWLDSPAREAIGDRLEPFWAGPPHGRVVTLVQEVGPGTPVSGR
jgi:heme-degrading monooxygenase HmoA